MATRDIKYETVGFSSGLHTVKGTHKDGRSATKSAKTDGAARKAVRAAIVAQSVPAQPSTPPASVPVASNPQLPAELFTQLSVLLTTLGMKAVPVDNPALTQSSEQVSKDDLKSFDQDPEGFAKARRDSHLATKAERNGTGKRLKSSVYKSWVDEGMISRGFQPVYRGRTQEQIHALNAQCFETMKAVNKAAKANAA